MSLMIDILIKSGYTLKEAKEIEKITEERVREWMPKIEDLKALGVDISKLNNKGD